MSDTTTGILRQKIDFHPRGSGVFLPSHPLTSKASILVNLDPRLSSSTISSSSDTSQSDSKNTWRDLFFEKRALPGIHWSPWRCAPTFVVIPFGNSFRKSEKKREKKNRGRVEESTSSLLSKAWWWCFSPNGFPREVELLYCEVQARWSRG